jgi:hypothetical protein
MPFARNENEGISTLKVTHPAAGIGRFKVRALDSDYRLQYSIGA